MFVTAKPSLQLQVSIYTYRFSSFSLFLFSFPYVCVGGGNALQVIWDHLTLPCVNLFSNVLFSPMLQQMECATEFSHVDFYSAALQGLGLCINRASVNRAVYCLYNVEACISLSCLIALAIWSDGSSQSRHCPN